MRRPWLSSTTLSGFAGGTLLSAATLSAATVWAADMSAPVLRAPAFEPAVDAFNTKWEGFGGSMAGKSVAGGTGVLTFPVASQYGAQIDGSVGSLDGSTFGAIGGHLFWRNPSQMLLGVYGNYTNWDRFGGVHLGQVAGETELYWGRLTLQGMLGVEFGNRASSTTASLFNAPIPFGFIPVLTTTTQAFDIKTRFTDQINLKYYVTDYASAYVGHRYQGGKNAAAFGGEFAFPVRRGVLGSAFVEARAGEANFHGVWGGLKLYFGPDDKPLIARHRREDPSPWDTMFDILNNSTPSTVTSSPGAKVCTFGTNESGACIGPS